MTKAALKNDSMSNDSTSFESGTTNGDDYGDDDALTASRICVFDKTEISLYAYRSVLISFARGVCDDRVTDRSGAAPILCYKPIGYGHVIVQK